MIGKTIIHLLFLGTSIGLFNDAAGQNLVNKKINVSRTQLVMIIFPAKISFYSIGDKETTNLFEHGITNDNNLTITSKVADFKTSMLIVKEGGNTHTFILDYKDRLNHETETVFNFSTKRLLSEEIKKLAALKVAPASSNTSAPVKNNSGSATTASTPVKSNSGGTTTAQPKLVTEPPVKTQKQLDDEHLALERQSVAEYVKGNFDKAKQLLLSALEQKPRETWCVEQLRKTEQKIVEKARLGKEALTMEVYRKHIMSADSAFKKQSLPFARLEYIEALRYNNTDRYAASQIAKIEKIQKDEHYKQLIKLGKDALKIDSLDQAEAAFKEALLIKAFDAEAKKGLAAVNTARGSLHKKSEVENRNMLKMMQYRDSITRADELFQMGYYLESKATYKNAKKLNPAENYPTSQIAGIDSIFLNRKAASVSKSKDSAETGLYNRTIQKADKALQAGDLKNAKVYYQDARKLKGEDPYPIRKIADIDIMLFEAKERKDEALMEQRKKEKETSDYQNLIKLGNAALAKKQYSIAEDYFRKAQQIRPSDPSLAKQLELISKKIEEINNQQAYTHFIHIADSIAFKARDPINALPFYDSARIRKPQEVYPGRQITSIKDQARKKAVKELDLQQQKERTERFNIAFKDYREADDARLQRKYTEAYIGFNSFLNQIDTAELAKYTSGESYHIIQAKDYLQRLESYKPKPVIDAMKTEPAPKKKSKKGGKKS